MHASLQKLFRLMVERGASDLFLSVDARPTIKVDGLSRPVSTTPMTEDQLTELVRSVLNDDEQACFAEELELNKAIDVPEAGRFRLNLYRQRGYPALVARFIQAEIPSLADLGMPDLLEKLVMQDRGLVLLVGAAGSGKSTTLASMIDYRNERQAGHILMLEDPIEFLHRHKKSIVDQREIGLDTRSFGNALRNAMREAPDVIVIGEIRDAESLRHAIHYAESGHLCLSTLHANNANQALERMLNFFDEQRQHQVLMDLALHLKAIVSQRLVRGQDGKRLPAVEVLLNSPLIRELIQTGRIDDVRDAMEKHGESGCLTFDQSLFRLWEAGRISREEALASAESQANLSVQIRLHHQTGGGMDGVRMQSDD